MKLRRRISARSSPARAPPCRRGARERSRPRGAPRRDRRRWAPCCCRSPPPRRRPPACGTGPRAARCRSDPGWPRRTTTRRRRAFAFVWTFNAKNRPSASSARAGTGAMIARLRVGEEGLRAPRDPFHRAAQAARRPHEQRFLGVVLALVAEASAHVGRDEPKPALGNAELGADVAANVVRRLGRAIQRVRRSNHAARFDRAAAEAVVDQLDTDHVGRLGQRRLDRGGVASRPLEAMLFHGRQRLVAHLNGLRRVFREVSRFGEHRRDRLPHVAHDLARERPARQLDHPGERPACAHRLNAVGLQVFSGKHDRLILPGANLDDAGMRVRRAHERAMQHRGKREVVDEAAAAGEKTRVLDAAHRRADHWISSLSKSSRS